MKSVRFAQILTMFILASLLNNTYAQFKKYRSKSKYDIPETEKVIETDDNTLPEIKVKNSTTGKSKSVSIKSKLDQKSMPGNGTDAFGRATGNSNIKHAQANSKYVNLNMETAFGPEVITSFDFPDTSLTDLTKHMQKLTGMNLIIEKELKGKVSIMAPTAITVGDAWKAYLTALNLNGYTLVKSGTFYKIVNARDIRYVPTKLYTGTYTPNTENYIMKIIPLKNINSSEVTRSFRPFITRYGRIIEIKQTNTIIVQDTGQNLNRLAKLIKFIDVPGHEETLQIIPVEHSSAQEIASLLDTILKSKGTSNTKSSSSGSRKQENNISKIIAEPRTNSIIAMANADGAKELINLIKKLDVKVNLGGGQIHVYYLNHGDAEALAKTLSTLVSGATKGKKSSRFTSKGGKEDTSLFNAEVKITADKDNNALVLTASPTDYLTIRNVIEKLDIPRDQVYVEGMIMETKVNKASGLGVSIVGAYGEGAAKKAGFAGGTGGSDLLALLTNNITSLGGLFVGGGTGKTITQTIGGTSVEIDSVTGLITAVANNSSTNILATPQIIALDNTEAVFEVGESVPVTEQTIANNQTQISVKQQKAGLSLKITPQINKVTRFVKLKIDQKIEEFQVSATRSSSGGLATTSRATVTTVVVRDRDTIAMGGHMRDKSLNAISKVPLLGDIPILGWLFKNTTTEFSKVNLLFFLTPKIMDSYQETVASTLQNVINRRSVHLKETIGENDPFGKTAESLYKKAKKQEIGPLYDELKSKKYQEQNDNKDGINNDNQVKLEAPNYKDILQKVNIKKSGRQKK